MGTIKRKAIEDMSLGELVDTFVGLKDEYKQHLVDENHPRPETWDKYGGIHAYNNKLMEEYDLIRLKLILELDKREKAYTSYLSSLART